jgi:uncharacterized coiled-coil protein SlyX
MTELTDIVHQKPEVEPTIDELKAQVSQLNIGLAIRDGRILDLQADIAAYQATIRGLDREIGDTRRLAAQTSFLANELSSQVAVQRTFIGAMDRAAGALVEKNVKKGAKLLRAARDGNPYTTPPEITAEARALLEKHNG